MSVLRSLLLAMAVLGSMSAFAGQCTGRTDTATKARQFMIDHGLILPGEELTFNGLGLELRWTLARVTPTSQGCFLVMGLCTYSDGVKDCSSPGALEVLGLKDDQVVAFEEIFPTPDRIVAKIGTNPKTTKEDLSYYFVLLEGPSVAAAYKSVLTDSPKGGFMGSAIRGQKASFDPTLKRDWRVVDATYDLRGGVTAEVLDIQAWQLDGLDQAGAEAYWQGCMPVEERPGTCQLGPWGQGFIRELIPAP